MSIITLKDTYLTEIRTDFSRTSGCPTCGFGSILTNIFELEFSNGKLIIVESSAAGSSRCDDCHGDIMTYQDIINVFNEPDGVFGEMDFDGFCEWIAKKLEAVVPHTYDSRGTEITVINKHLRF